MEDRTNPCTRVPTLPRQGTSCPGLLTYGYAGADVCLLPPVFPYSNEDALQHDPLQVMGDFKLMCCGTQCVLQSCVLCIGILDAAGVLIWQHYKVFIPARHLLLPRLLWNCTAMQYFEIDGFLVHLVFQNTTDR